MDNFFQNERNKNTNLAALSKVATEVHYLSRVFFFQFLFSQRTHIKYYEIFYSSLCNFCVCFSQQKLLDVVMTEQSKSVQEVYMYAQDTLFRNRLYHCVCMFYRACFGLWTFLHISSSLCESGRCSCCSFLQVRIY